MKFKKLLHRRLGLMLIVLFLWSCSAQPNISTSGPPSATVQAPVASTAIETPLATVTGNYEVNGHSLYIECLGSGSPTIVLEPGEGGSHSDMKELQMKLATHTTACAYDRAETGSLRTAQDVVNDLHELLTAANVPAPFVLVGSSAGGLFVQLYVRK